MFRKLAIVAAQIIATIAFVMAPNPTVVDAGIGYCLPTSQTTTPLYARSYCQYSSSNNQRHQIRAKLSNGTTIYGPWRNGGESSWAYAPSGTTILYAWRGVAA
jgi:hypothetical protein